MSFGRSALVLAAVLILAPAPGTAQLAPSDSTLVDRVVAVVGDSVVLLSQVEEEIAQMRLQGQQVPTDPDQLRSLEKSVLNDWVDRLLLLQAAAKDTLVKIDESQVTDAVNQDIKQRAQAMGGQDALQTALEEQGMTLASFRDYWASQIRQQQTQQMYLQLKLQDAAPVEVTDQELHEAFQRASTQLQQRPAYVKFHQVVIAPQPSDSAEANAKALAESLLERLKKGEKFDELAKRYSDDPGSAPLGGDLGWFRRGHMVKAFEDAAWSLLPGQVSGVVKTDFGYHIIKLERARQGERKARHILISPNIHPGDVERARAEADTVAAKAKADSSMERLYQEYSDSISPDTITVALNQLSQYPPSYSALKSASTGEVLGPLAYHPTSDETRFAVVKVDEVRQAGAYTFDEVKDQFAQRLQQQKQVAKLLKALREKTYVDIRM